MTIYTASSWVDEEVASLGILPISFGLIGPISRRWLGLESVLLQADCVISRDCEHQAEHHIWVSMKKHMDHIPIQSITKRIEPDHKITSHKQTNQQRHIIDKSYTKLNQHSYTEKKNATGTRRKMESHRGYATATFRQKKKGVSKKPRIATDAFSSSK
jgi:hypothetical protein